MNRVHVEDTRMDSIDRRSLVARIPALAAALVAAVAVWASLATASAHAAFGITPDTFTFTTSSTQAGAHADVTTSFTLNDLPDHSHPDGNLKDVVVDLPAGFSGTPAGLPSCDNADLDRDPGTCSPSTQVGIATFNLDLFGLGMHAPAVVPIYNLRTDTPHAALFGTKIIFASVRLFVEVRPGDAGIRTVIKNSSEIGGGVWSASVTLWGVPADPVHDVERYNGAIFDFGMSAGVPPAPLMRNPTSCAGATTASLRVSSWQDHGTWHEATAGVPAITGCDKLPFSATVGARPTTGRAGAPSGYVVDVGVPQSVDPVALATSDLRRAVVRLPEGVALSPAVANGLQGCSDEQLGFGADGPGSCPDASRIGTASLETPALRHPLTGAIHLGTPRPDDPYRVFVVLTGPDAVAIKLRGSVHADPATGQLTATFDDNPQQPFTKLQLRFKGGAHAPLVNPASCGTYTTTADVTPWSGRSAVAASSTFALDEGCGAHGFAPSFTAGTTSPLAGRSSSFTLGFSRSDADAELRDVDVRLPEGLIAQVASVPLCPEPSAAAGTCPAASRVGSVATAVGPGADPLQLPGSVALTGPYKGAPFGLSIAVPAVAGPFDLGTVVVRAAVHVDPETTALRIVSDPLPTIVGGIPLRMRGVTVTIDRPGFMRNPTSCAEQQVAGTLGAVGGQRAPVAERFAVADCAALPLEPRLKVALTGRGQTARGKHPALRATLTQRGGQGNLDRVALSLPKSLSIDTANTAQACPFEAGQKAACPDGSVIGHATLKTPLLDAPLTGTVHLVEGRRVDPKTGKATSTLPTLLVALHGQLDLVLRATTAVRGGRIVTTFHDLPDAPLSSFALTIDGGAKGVLKVASAGLCRATQRAVQRIDGQNGRSADATMTVATGCRSHRAKRARTERLPVRRG